MRFTSLLIPALFLITSCGKTEKTQPAPEKPSAEPVLRMSVEEFLQKVDGGVAEGAREEYRGKVIELTGHALGIVQDYTIERGLETSIVMVPDESSTRNSISCLPADKHIHRKFTPGEAVLRGTVREHLRLEDCVLVSAKSPPPARITLERYHQELTKDVKAAHEKYHDRYTIIVATLKAVNDASPRTVEISSGGVQTSIVVAPYTLAKINSLKIGQQFEFVCRPTIYIEEPNRVILDFDYIANVDD